MWIVPELAAVLAALVFAIAVGLPGFHRALQRRRRALRMCLRCGRTVLLGERTCDCESTQ
jgi:hypothetical protein